MTIRVTGKSLSSTKEFEYAIFEDSQTGSISCSCLGYHHRQTCRHIGDYQPLYSHENITPDLLGKRLYYIEPARLK